VVNNLDPIIQEFRVINLAKVKIMDLPKTVIKLMLIKKQKP